MSIRIREEPDIVVTAGELARYRKEYLHAYMYYAGARPTLEEFIRSRQAHKASNFHQELAMDALRSRPGATP